MTLLQVAPDRLRFVPIEQIGNETLAIESGPAEDMELIRRLVEVMRGTMQVTNATVDFELIELYDPGYALRIPEALIDVVAERIASGTAPPLLLYWNGSKYKSSDDHDSYMAHRQLRNQHVEATILGEVGPVIETIRCGGAELIPPLSVMSEYPDEVLAKWQWELKKCAEGVSPEYLELTALYMQLATLIAKPTRESDLHKLLKQSPRMLDAYGNRLFSEVRLGGDYRIDLALEFGGSNAHILLVELESAGHQLFTKKGRWRSPIVHAIQQVEDWLRWWHEHSEHLPNGWDPSTPIQGLVVAGRSRDLVRDQQRRLVHLNKGKQVQVVTYDDLLDRIEQLLSSA